MKALAILLLLIAGCSSPTAPTAIEPLPVNLAGRWEGTINYPAQQGWNLVVNFDDDNFVWKENCPFACARLNIARSGTFTISPGVVNVRFTAPDRGTATLSLITNGCLQGSIALDTKSGTTRVCR